MRKAIVHILIGAAVNVMVFMGLWQLDRLDTKQKLNQEVKERTAATLLPIEEVVAANDQWAVGESLKFRRSIFALKTINKGEKFSNKNIRSFRPFLGIGSENYNKILGKKSKKNIEKFSPIMKNDIT